MQMTANALSESAEECFANGMDSFVSKPVTLQKLKDCLEQYLQWHILVNVFLCIKKEQEPSKVL